MTEIFDVTEDEVRKMLHDCDCDDPDSRDWLEKNKDWINHQGWELSSSSDKGRNYY